MIIQKKVIRTMMDNKSQYLGSLALIVLSCLMFTMFTQLTKNLSGLTSSFEKKYVQEDANFRTDKQIDTLPLLESQFDMKIEQGSSFDYPVSAQKVLRVFSENERVNIPAILQGSKLGIEGMLIDPAYAKANGLHIGDRVKIYDRAFTISGFMALPNYIYPLKSEGDILTDPNNFGVAVIGKSDYAAIGKGNGFYCVKFNNGFSQSVVSSLQSYLKSADVAILNWTNASANLRITMVQTKLSGISQVSSVLPTSILLLCCILTGIVILRMMKRESAIIGTLYAMGYRKKQIRSHYMRYPLWIALSGGIVGTLLGVLAIKPMIGVLVSYFNMPVDAIVYEPVYCVISLILPVVFLCGSGFLVIGKALKSTPLELIRGGMENNRIGFMEKRLRLQRLRFSSKFKIREQLRSIPRSAFLLLGVAIATMLLLVGFAAKSSMDYVMNDGFKQAFKYQYHYVFNSVQQGTPTQGEAFSEALFTAKAGSAINIAVFGVSPKSQFITFSDKDGNSLPTNQVILTKPLAEKLSVKQNDTIHIISEADSKEYSVRVDSIADTYVGNYIYMPLTDFNRMMHYPDGSYVGLWSKDKLNIPEDKLLASLSVDDMKGALNSMMQPIQAAVGVLAIVSFVIGLIVIYVVTSMIIEENKENISLMKILGYRKKEVNSLIINSSSFLVILGYILGIPLLFASLGAMLQSLTKQMSIVLPLRVDPLYLLFGFVVIYLTYALSKQLSKRKVGRIRMDEILKSRLE